jgi:hypothetical protein
MILLKITVTNLRVFYKSFLVVSANNSVSKVVLENGILKSAFKLNRAIKFIWVLKKKILKRINFG